MWVAKCTKKKLVNEKSKLVNESQTKNKITYCNTTASFSKESVAFEALNLLSATGVDPCHSPLYTSPIQITPYLTPTTYQSDLTPIFLGILYLLLLLFELQKIQISLNFLSNCFLEEYLIFQCLIDASFFCTTKRQ